MLRMQPLPLPFNTKMMMMLLFMFCDDRSLVSALPFWSSYDMGNGHGICSEKWKKSKIAYFTTTTKHATLLKLVASSKHHVDSFLMSSYIKWWGRHKHLWIGLVHSFVCFHHVLNLFGMSVVLLFIIIICGIITTTITVASTTICGGK